MAKKSGSPMLAVETEGKPLDKKSARTRMRILDAAAQVLSAKGYAGMRLSDVAKVADLQAPAIYYYFPDKDALVLDDDAQVRPRRAVRREPLDPVRLVHPALEGAARDAPGSRMERAERDSDPGPRVGQIHAREAEGR